MSADLAPVWTERRMLDLLKQRHSAMVGNGPVWGYMEHVRDGAGFSVQTTIDALAIHMWPSKHHAMHAFEVKVGRGDWLRELKQPHKAGAWTSIVDYFWVAAPSGVVKLDELPDKWGLLVPHGPGLRVARQSRALRPMARGYEPMPPLERALVVSMIRAAAKCAARPELAR